MKQEYESRVLWALGHLRMFVPWHIMLRDKGASNKYAFFIICDLKTNVLLSRFHGSACASPTLLTHVRCLSRETPSLFLICAPSCRPLTWLFSGLFTGMRQAGPTHVTSRHATTRHGTVAWPWTAASTTAAVCWPWRVKFKVSNKRARQRKRERVI